MNQLISTSVSSSVVPPNITIAKADSGASKHYFRKEDQICLQQCTPSAGPTVHSPNLDTITSNAAGFLTLAPSISNTAKLAHIFDNLHSASLVSLGQLCDDGCKVLLDHSNMYVFKNNSIVLKGYRIFSDGLWDVPLGDRSYKITKCNNQS